jgi:hypothetical protein
MNMRQTNMRPTNMRPTTRRPIRYVSTIAAGFLAIGLLGGCSQKYGAERDGKKLGEALCDLKEADSQESADAAMQEINEQLSDIENKYSIWTAEDRARIDENLADLAGHVADDNQVLERQDVAVITRNLEQAKDDASEITRATIDGIEEGLDGCLTG